MNERKPKDEPRSWLERLGDLLLREPQDREQLVNLLRDAEQRHLLDANALAMIEGVLEVSNMQVRDIMVPRSQMIVIEEDAPLANFLPDVIESGHSRFPVIGHDRDQVIGILLAKDLLKIVAEAESTRKFSMRDILRPAYFVPESKRLDSLLQELRINRNHMAIVVDEYGGVAGLVTIEDVLEQIVGDIEDEYDIDDEVYIKKHSEREFIVKALTPIEEFNRYFNSTFHEEESDTIGGLVMQHLGHVPSRGEIAFIEPYGFKVLHADNRRILLLQVTLLEKADYCD